jgi:hypothetical protein
MNRWKCIHVIVIKGHRLRLRCSIDTGLKENNGGQIETLLS